MFDIVHRSYLYPSAQSARHKSSPQLPAPPNGTTLALISHLWPPFSMLPWCSHVLPVQSKDNSQCPYTKLYPACDVYFYCTTPGQLQPIPSSSCTLRICPHITPPVARGSTLRDQRSHFTNAVWIQTSRPEHGEVDNAAKTGYWSSESTYEDKKDQIKEYKFSAGFLVQL